MSQKMSNTYTSTLIVETNHRDISEGFFPPEGESEFPRKEWINKNSEGTWESLAEKKHDFQQVGFHWSS